MPNKRYRLIAGVRVENETWILEPRLQRTTEFADGIIAFNDGFADDSPKILRSFPKALRVVDKPPMGEGYQLPDRNRTIFADWAHTWLVHLRSVVPYAIQVRKRCEDLHDVVDRATSRMDETGLKLAPLEPAWGTLPLPSEWPVQRLTEATA